MAPRMAVLLGAALVTAAGAVAAAPRPVLRYVNGTLATIVNASSPGSAGNRHGFEDGSVTRIGNTTHMFVSELVGDPLWIKMRLAHWRTTAPSLSLIHI